MGRVKTEPGNGASPRNGPWARLRAALRRFRVERRGMAAIAARPFRFAHYAWNLVIWSRITAGRLRLAPLELPLETLAKKGVRLRPPRLEMAGGSTAEAFSAGFAEVYSLLFANLQMPGLLSRQRHAVPAPAFRGVYLWDSAFIGQVWAHWDPAVAREVLGAVLELRDGDRLAHVVSEFARSEYTQPPLVAWSLEKMTRYLRADEQEAYYRRTLPILRAYQGWLENHRSLPDGLLFWQHPYESGMDNAPRFSNRTESEFADTRPWAAPDFTSYTILQLEALSRMAETLGLEDEKPAFAATADLLRGQMNSYLWHEEDGLYYDRDTRTGAFIREPTIASLVPLWAGVPSPAQARRLVAWLEKPEGFGTLIPLPSVARSHTSYEPDMWRGPVWVNMAYGVILGLLRYGYDDLAGELAWRLCLGVYRVFHIERQIYEFYDPDHFSTRGLDRKRGNWWKAFTLGTKPQREFVGWSGLVNNLVIEVLCGVEVSARTLRLRPRLPAAAEGLRWDLDLPAYGLHLHFFVESDRRVVGLLEWQGRAQSFSLAAGQSLVLAAP